VVSPSPLSYRYYLTLARLNKEVKVNFDAVCMKVNGVRPKSVPTFRSTAIISGSRPGQKTKVAMNIKGK
jgi:hypothetical protein